MIASLAGLPSVAEQRGADPLLLAAELRWHVEQAITRHPRSQQTRIGPSELGTPCTRCLAFKLAGVPEQRDPAWLPTVGTAVHAWLADTFTQANRGLDVARWLVEMTVDVGDVDGTAITGSSDLFDRVTATVIDHKVVGPTTLKTAKAGPSAVYRTQLHLYGRGFTRRGLPVDQVAIWYVPRNAVTLDQAVFWSEPYDESVALAALARADALAKAIRLVGVDQVVAGMSTTPGCYSCPGFPRADGTRAQVPGHHTPDRMADLVSPTISKETAA
jgi:hypothetical protein